MLVRNVPHPPNSLCPFIAASKLSQCAWIQELALANLCKTGIKKILQHSVRHNARHLWQPGWAPLRRSATQKAWYLVIRLLIPDLYHTSISRTTIWHVFCRIAPIIGAILKARLRKEAISLPGSPVSRSILLATLQSTKNLYRCLLQCQSPGRMWRSDLDTSERQQ